MINSVEEIYNASLKFLTPLTSKETYEIICKEGIRLIGANYSSIVLEQNGFLKRIYATHPKFYNVPLKQPSFAYKSFKKHKIYILDVDKIPTINPEIRELKTKSVIIIPLSYRKKSIGVFSALSFKKKTFSKDELSALKLFGSMASLAITKTLAHEETKRVSEEKESYKNLELILEKINRAGLKFLAPLTPLETYQIIITEAVKLLQATFGSLFLIEDDQLIRKAVYPNESKFLFEVRKRGFTYRSYSENKTFVIQSKELTLAHPELKKMGYKSAICIPISYHQKSIGSLVLLSHLEHKFSNKELALLKLFGSYTSLAIRNAQLHQENKNALETRDLFISMAAHELRTPITTIHGYMQLLHRKLSGKNTQESRWSEELSLEIQRLIDLVNELLEVNRIKEGQLNYVWKENSLRKILKRAISNFSFSYPDRKILFEDKLKNKSDIVVSDFNKLLQAFNNVLDNAGKFSPSTREINVTLKSTKRSISIAFQDRGQGIEEKDLSKIFDGIYKKTRNPAQEGMGLGLYLTKNIVKMHRGFIEVKSKLNKGTCVCISLPLKPLS